MKESLKDKTIHNGQLARELIESGAFQALLKVGAEKKELVLKEVLAQTDIKDVRYMAGFIDGLDFLGGTVDQWSRKAENLKKRN